MARPVVAPLIPDDERGMPIIAFTRDSDFEWQGGPPPFIGWWCASRTGVVQNWRWWNGQDWSQACRAGMSAAQVARRAQTPASPHTLAMRWCLHWPHNACVQRIDAFNPAMRGRAPAPEVWSREPAGKWQTGAPPFIGWWNAGTMPRPDIWRWWDGAGWSMPAHQSDSAEQAAVAAARPSGLPLNLVRWTRNWPRRASPRLDLAKLERQELLTSLPAPGMRFFCEPKPVSFRFRRLLRSEVVRSPSGTRHGQAGDVVITGHAGEPTAMRGVDFGMAYVADEQASTCYRRPLQGQAKELDGGRALQSLRQQGLSPRAGDFLVHFGGPRGRLVPRADFLNNYRLTNPSPSRQPGH